MAHIGSTSNALSGHGHLHERQLAILDVGDAIRTLVGRLSRFQRAVLGLALIWQREPFHCELGCGASLIALVAVLVVHAEMHRRRGWGWASAAPTEVLGAEGGVVVVVGVAPEGGCLLGDGVTVKASHQCLGEGGDA